MAISNFEEAIKYDVERALYQPIANGLSVLEWAKIGMNSPRWISVEDRLPPAHDTCITAIKDDSGDTTFRYVYFGWYLPKGECWIIDDEARTDVYAWMPLPEPPVGSA